MKMQDNLKRLLWGPAVMVTEVNDCKIAVLSRIYGEMNIIHGQMNS